jgi:signal peptidase II
MRKKILLIVVITVIFDQLTKYLIIHNLNLNDMITIIPQGLYLTHVNNYGAAWGLFSDRLFFLIIFGLLALIIIYQSIINLPVISKVNLISYGLLAGGIIGNLIDRFRFGYVVDFINMYIIGYSFPVFNISDMAIVFGVIIIIYDILKKEKTNESNNR